MKPKTEKIFRWVCLLPLLGTIGYFNAFNFLDTKNKRIASVAFLPEKGLRKVLNIEPDPPKTAQQKGKAKVEIKQVEARAEVKMSSKQRFLALKGNDAIRIDNDGIRDLNTGVVKETTIETAVKTAEYLWTKGEILHLSCFRAGNNFRIHRNGFAFDISNEKVARILLPWLVENKDELKIREIIFDSSLIGKNPNYYNYYEGKPHNFNSGTLRSHRNHIHVATY